MASGKGVKNKKVTSNKTTSSLQSSGAISALKNIANQRIAKSGIQQTPVNVPKTVEQEQTIAQGKTAQFGDKGQYTYNVDSRGIPFGKPIPADIIGNTPKVSLPEKEQPTNYSSMLNGVTASLGAPTGGLIPPQQTPTQEETTAPKQKSLQDTVNEMLGLYKGPVNQAELYAKAEEQAGIQQKQQAVQSLTNQLNAITAKSQADQLSVTGQGRGIPEAIIGGQQAQISKEAAIQSLPIAAQLSAAQGDLENAQNHLDSYFKMVVADAEAETEYYNKSVDMAYNLFSKAEQRQLDEIKDQKNSDIQTMRDSVNFAQSLAMQALQNGDRVAFKGLTSIVPPNPNSKTFQQDLIRFNKTISSYGGGLAGTVRSDMDTSEGGITESQKIDQKIIATPQFKSAQAAQNLKNTLDKAVDAVTKYGNKEKIDAEGRGILDSLKIQLRSEISTALEQGVVQPGEAASFDEIAGQLNKSFFIRDKKTLGSLNSLKNSMDSRIKTQKAALKAYGADSMHIDELLGVASNLDENDLKEIQTIYGGKALQTSGSFNPANYY